MKIIPKPTSAGGIFYHPVIFVHINTMSANVTNSLASAQPLYLCVACCFPVGLLPKTFKYLSETRGNKYRSFCLECSYSNYKMDFIFFLSPRLNHCRGKKNMCNETNWDRNSPGQLARACRIAATFNVNILFCTHSVLCNCFGSLFSQIMEEHPSLVHPSVESSAHRSCLIIETFSNGIKQCNKPKICSEALQLNGSMSIDRSMSSHSHVVQIFTSLSDILYAEDQHTKREANLHFLMQRSSPTRCVPPLCSAFIYNCTAISDRE